MTPEAAAVRAHGGAARAAILLRWLPPSAVIFAAALGGVMVAITLAKGLGDPDFFWHLTTGRLIATTGQVPSVDPFSFTWGGRPWTTHEWLSELLIYLLVTVIGIGPSLFVFGLFAGATFGMLVLALANRGISVAAIALPTALSAWIVVPYMSLRPQVISWFLMAVLLVLLWGLRGERPRRALLLVPLFLLWANLHGLYVVGLGVLLLYLIFTLAGRTPMSSARAWLLAAAAGSLLASALTPSGPSGILYPLRYVDAGDWGLANIQEWQSPNFHAYEHLGLLALILAIGANASRATPGWLAVLSYLGVAMSLIALRNGPLAAVWAVPTLALGLDDRLRTWRDARVSSGIRLTRSPVVAAGRRVLELVAAALVVAAAFVVVARAPAVDPARRFPEGAVTRLLQLDPDARVMAEYGWGGYVLSRVYDSGGRVFVDGRNDMYDQAILEDYDAVRAADPGWEAVVERWGVEAMIWPASVTIARGPAELAGWCEAYRDERSVLYLPACPGQTSDRSHPPGAADTS